MSIFRMLLCEPMAPPPLEGTETSVRPRFSGSFLQHSLYMGCQALGHKGVLSRVATSTEAGQRHEPQRQFFDMHGLIYFFALAFPEPGLRCVTHVE
jgi:hypothetical protein